jgi:cellulose synthase/poly-beta-1,6-N-acetylglucosamine synthase-like glycosyltransferase
LADRAPVHPAVVWLGVVIVATFAAATSLQAESFFYLLYISLSLIFGAIAMTTLVWMLHAWRTPDSVDESRLDDGHLPPAHSFSLIVPARHEEAVLEETLSRLLTIDHPAFEVLVVVGSDDAATRQIADAVARRHPEQARVIVDTSQPKNKPKALNAALPYCTGTVTGVFDAEDLAHPGLLTRIDECFQETDADVVQAGVQLMNFRSSWLSVRNVLEYYFWFRSRLHLHARQQFIPLGGNTVFIRTELLRAVSGWDTDCLAEDCELGVRLSALGAKTVVVYEPELVTREECPPTLRAFTRQRTRWNQGYLQTLLKGCWRRLPLRQRAVGLYILGMPYLLSVAWLMLPIAIATAIAVRAPILITLVSFLPAVPILSMLAVEVAGLGDFCRTYGEQASARDYVRLVLGLPLYQAVLAFSAARAVAREARRVRGWEKTAHLGLHLSGLAPDPPPEADGRLRIGSRPRMRCEGRSRSPARDLRHESAAPVSGGLRPRVAERHPTVSRAGTGGTAGVRATPLSHLPIVEVSKDNDIFSDRGEMSSVDRAATGNGSRNPHNRLPDNLFGATGSEPGGVGLGLLAPGSVTLWPPGIRREGSRRASASWLDGARARLGRFAVMRHADLAVQVVLLTGVGLVMATNMLHWPGILFDEGTYVSNAWAVQHRAALAFYTYTYGHPPLGWLLIFIWTWASGIFGHATYSLDGARELMFVVSIVSCSLLYTLARRLELSRPFAAGAVIMFALSPVALFFHRGVLLDNPATAWVLAAFVLALSPRRRLWSFAGSGACFAASVLSKETTLVILPALLLAAFQNADRRTRRYCLTLFVSFLVLVGFLYPLYATLKGELLPGPGHVSLIGTEIDMLFGRTPTGSVFNPHSVAHGTVSFWLALDPWLPWAGLVLSPLALVCRNTRAIALAYLIQVAMILRPGYLPAMYVIALLPFAALIVAGTTQALWRFAAGGRPRHRQPSGAGTWHVIASRTAVLLRPAAIAASVLVLAAEAAVVVRLVAPRWVRDDRAAMTTRQDGAQRAAERWLVHNVSHKQRLIVTDDFWIYLIEHGFDSHPVKGGFNSRTVVSYWPLDKDPAVRRYFPGGWREFNYIVSTEAMRDTATYVPNTAQALQHSRVVATFGRGTQRIEIRAITGTPLSG